jgi:predicted acyl esterase
MFTGRRGVVFFASAVLALALVPAPARATDAATADGATPWPGGRWQPEAPSYGMAVEENVPVVMDDGANLVANIGYPADATGGRATGTFPVLLTQAPYVSSQKPQSFFVNRGYINAVVQIRGTGDTSGPNGEPIANDMFGKRQARDGAALVDWAAKLPKSNGNVGLYGCSQLGISQIFTAAALGPNSPLKAIAPACASNGYDTYFSGGMPSQIVGLFGKVSSASLSGPKNAEVNDAYNKGRHDEILAGGPMAYDGAYWQVRTTANALPKIVENKIPALLWSGWNPTDGPGSLYEYAVFQNAWAGRPPFGSMSPNQRTTGRYQVVIGPWNHGQGLDDSIMLEWYDTWLKGKDTGMADTRTPMHLFELESNRWVNAAKYPITDDYTALHLNGNGALSTTEALDAGSAQLEWGAPSSPNTTLTFDAPPLDTAKVVAGPVGATIYAKSSTRNVNLIASLNDVAPDGQVTQLVTGSIVGSLRAVDKQTSWLDKNGLMVRPDHPFKKDDYAKPGSLQRYEIALTPTLSSVAAGHYLQVVLSTQPPANKCESLISALTIALPCLPTAPQRESLDGGVYEIVWGKSSPSSVNVPLVDPRSLPQATSGMTDTSKGQVEPLDWSS